ALVAFGAIGFVDAIGSAALAYHFRHTLRHDAPSEQLERLAHRAVIIGLLVVGLGAVGGSVARLVGGESVEPSTVGVVLAAVSLVVLLALSARKLALAGPVGSPALRTDGHLSAVGAAQAGVTVVGAVVTRWFGWYWADAVAGTVLGCVAVTVAVATWAMERRTLPGPD
ncbi:MAG TPA: cation transporter, partial [Acidimicrobiia bacterium]|nr:cation transporter [Acidimicrobiia bacterium]